ncbi:hypothetical protein [Undibacterium sp. YM2]|uniref:hypothetical protein n=1 Tax=Undibacterium sp. YM2 TaxID=2058625 RepID=UPI0013895FD4|nr:hypothetical protein [Undibacterium sp. YM2]
MATISNRSNYLVTVKNRADLQQSFPFIQTVRRAFLFAQKSDILREEQIQKIT